MTIMAKLVDIADRIHPATTTVRATSMTRRFIVPSASRPMAGVAIAPVISAAVSNHCAVLSDTPSARAMLGISGAPRLLTMAVSTATLTRVGRTALRRKDIVVVGAGIEEIRGDRATATASLSSVDDIM
jgi:hypothetical protein